ncbi:MAG TPA: hydroxymethylpyrimidine/phosphomethylpyrimidine kinase [Bacteroidia bacterium]|jgi:hydroxymethylpyrimidine/phosphomethylpyrimidine kinase|nr:hydroxymethylpyrimidine/phosphomethylpyrimidine kinase [Bacteroidia bacterium]
MSNGSRPYVLSIAGFDPSAGAGVLADIKTMEACHVYGFGVCTSITFQHDQTFKGLHWLPEAEITQQIDVLLERFRPSFIKIGLIENLHLLLKLIKHIRTTIPEAHFIWDPILRASAGYSFHSSPDIMLLQQVCEEVFLLTPNLPEALELGETESAELNAAWLSNYCNVFLKGGHRNDRVGEDTLFLKQGKRISYGGRTQPVFPKHGSGCILSSAICSFLAKGAELQKACLLAKEYTLEVLDSNESLLGFHTPTLSTANLIRQ